MIGLLFGASPTCGHVRQYGLKEDGRCGIACVTQVHVPWDFRATDRLVVHVTRLTPGQAFHPNLLNIEDDAEEAEEEEVVTVVAEDGNHEEAADTDGTLRDMGSSSDPLLPRQPPNRR